MDIKLIAPAGFNLDREVAEHAKANKITEDEMIDRLIDVAKRFGDCNRVGDSVEIFIGAHTFYTALKLDIK